MIYDMRPSPWLTAQVAHLRTVQREADAPREQRHDELIEADALLRGKRNELPVKGGGHPHKDFSTGFHSGDDSACAIDIPSSACDTTPMITKTVSITLKVQVDPAAWAETYGDDGDLSASVRDYVQAQIGQSAAAEEGAILEVKRR